jgi:DNA-binding NarL/FixJ family response regulator
MILRTDELQTDLPRPSKSRVLRVLVVEDEPRIREAIVVQFKRDPGFEVVGQAGSLADARGMLERADVAILDVGLPDGVGIDLIPELRAVNSHMPVLVLTASRDRAMLTRAIEYGAAAVLDKMTHLGQVVESVRHLLAGERLTPPIPNPRCPR